MLRENILGTDKSFFILLEGIFLTTLLIGILSKYFLLHMRIVLRSNQLMRDLLFMQARTNTKVMNTTVFFSNATHDINANIKLVSLVSLFN